MLEQLIIHKLPWLLSALSIYIQWALGSKRAHAWLLSLVSQALWLSWIVTSERWGFLPLNVSLWVMAVRNYHKWKKEDTGGR